MNICLYGASSNLIDKKYIDATEKLGEAMGKRGHCLVYGGGSGGLMGAAARGMTAAGGKITGVSPDFFKVDGELYDKCTEFIFTQTMSGRKHLLEEKADAFVIVPGGPGTFDEFFEILALSQLGIHRKPIALYNIDGYYEPMKLLLQNAVEKKFMREECLQLCPLFENENDILTYFENFKGIDYDFSVMRKIEK